MNKTPFIRERGRAFRFSETERQRLERMSDAEIEANAATDPDNPPLTEEQLRRMQIAREVRNIRERTGLSQPQFAARYRIALGRLRDFEQARSEPDVVVRVFYRLILEDPDRAEILIRQVEQTGV
jgi:putative transcriptional regulator